MRNVTDAVGGEEGLVQGDEHEAPVLVRNGAPRGWAEELRTRLRGAWARRRSVIVESQADAQVLGQVLARESPDDVYFDLGARIDEQLLARLGARLLMDGTAVHFVLPSDGGPPVRAEAARIGSHRVVSLRSVHDSAGARFARRVLDIVGAGVLLVVLSPLLAVVSVLVWAKMGGPIFYGQERVGRDGRLFHLYKFRSMVTNADEILRASPAVYARYVAENFKLPPAEDPRITPLGHLLRRTSLDELPQLWNVLRGEMSLVGPRAVVPEEVAEYGDYGKLLLRIKPGVTGVWQVSGRSTIGYPARARMDLEYVGRRSFGRDLAILLRTLPAVIRQRGAL